MSIRTLSGIANSRCSQSRNSARRSLMRSLSMLATFALGIQTLAIGESIDHLVPLERKGGSALTYERMWHQKLLVTPGDLARFIFLPGNFGEEYATSLYATASSSGQSNCQITLTRASSSIAKCVPSRARVTPPNDLQKVNIFRCDIPFPRSTANKVHEVWLAMLADSRREKADRSVISVDSSTEIFSAKDSRGNILNARLPMKSLERGNTKVLFELAALLVTYCDSAEKDRPGMLREIERRAEELRKRLHRK